MEDWNEVRRWRKAERERIVAQRMAMSLEERQRFAAAIAERLAESRELAAAPSVGFFWPMRGEPDLRPLVRALLERGIEAALPVVVERNKPLEFWRWHAGSRMTRQSVWNIPIPADAVLARPAALLIPLIGFDGGCYRLGYGGGYYDRTLASLDPKPYSIGVGYAFGRLDSIHPQPHDVPMDLIVTELETLAR